MRGEGGEDVRGQKWEAAFLENNVQHGIRGLAGARADSGSRRTEAETRPTDTGGSATAATTSKRGGRWKRAGEGGKRLGDGLGDSQPRFADAKVEQTQTAISRETTID